MIQAFVDHLRLHYGDDTTALRTRFHLPDNGPIDAPRNLRRGPWDNYSDDNPFFKEWLDFNVHAINRMHAAGCREALLAGFPPELIKGQFIPTPNNPATGPATTILANSPATYAMIAGTGFGFGNPDPDHTNTQSTLHLARAAHSSGFHSIAIHQSHPSTNDPSDALQWLQSLRQFGTHSIQFNNPTEADATSLQTTHAAMQKAIQSLANETETTNIPPLQSSGTHQIRPFTNNDTPIAILSTTSGLIQSIHADGSHEGSVFVVPFHTRLAIEEINFHPSETTQQSAPFTLTPGAQIDIDFHVSNAISPGPIEFKILRHGQPLPGLYGQLPVSSNQTAMRLQFRCHSTIDNLTVEITPPPNASLSIHTATIQSPMTASLNANGNKGTPHKGGIFFTLLD